MAARLVATFLFLFPLYLDKSHLCHMSFAAIALAEEHKATNTQANRRATGAIKACPSLGLPQVGDLPEFVVPILLDVQQGWPLAWHPTLWQQLKMSWLLILVDPKTTCSQQVPSAMQLGLLEALKVAAGSGEVPLHLSGSNASTALLWATNQAGAVGLKCSNSSE
jgi:hypothetical protein